jgi:cysteine synthase A
MNEGILSAIGNTPLIRLARIFKESPVRVFAKLEALNPGGSMKDRAAFSIIEHAIQSRKINPGTTVIESSSGNMGVGLAQACAYFGLRLICVVDPKTTAQNIQLIEAYGAEVDMVSEPDRETGEFLKARINRVKQLTRSIKDSFWPDQYSNLRNPLAHHQTMREIITGLDGPLDYLFCATSTCGTLRGCAEYKQAYNLATKIYAVDAVGSVIFGGCRKKRIIPGHGAAIQPPLFRDDLADECFHITDLECVIGCRLLARTEAILAGGSSGAVLMAIRQALPSMREGANCVAVFADRGERYLDTIYSDSWVMEHFGDSYLSYKNALEADQCIAMTY